MTEPDFELTEPERQVLARLASGLGPLGVAKALFISQKTVRNHVRNVMDKVTAATPPD